ncbi:MAG: hypothetical protein MZW92_78580 [Comamonadaceae bacterium]|nr:hypothetical protein [Comamonadaceae bacterium]
MEAAAGELEPGEAEALAAPWRAPRAACRAAASSSASSVTVPGVTTRTTWRSTGPFAVGRVADLLADRHRLAELAHSRAR